MHGSTKLKFCHHYLARIYHFYFTLRAVFILHFEHSTWPLCCIWTVGGQSTWLSRLRAFITYISSVNKLSVAASLMYVYGSRDPKFKVILNKVQDTNMTPCWRVKKRHFRDLDSGPWRRRQKASPKRVWIFTNWMSISFDMSRIISFALATWVVAEVKEKVRESVRRFRLAEGRSLVNTALGFQRCRVFLEELNGRFLRKFLLHELICRFVSSFVGSVVGRVIIDQSGTYRV